MSFIPRLPLFAATLTLLTLALAVVFLSGYPAQTAQAQTDTTTTTTTTTVDYDSNDDRLIEISNLAQLNAIRWDLNGDGAVDAANSASYSAAFPNAAAGMGCPDGSDADTNPDPCLGYELKADLSFDTNNDGSVTVADSGGLYWNGGAGWTPMGDARRHTYTGQFQGRGKTISHLFINNSAALYVGLFGAIGPGGRVTGLGMEQVSIASSRPAVAGGIVGSNRGSITASYATGTITVNAGGATNGNTLAGGLVGHNALGSAVQASFAEVTVAASHSRTAAIAGGLVGQNDGNIRASYAAGAVSATGVNRFTKAGGLAGNNGGTITASYARGRVTATGSGTVAGGLVGGVLRSGTASASYWDTATSGQTASAGGTGQTSSALQSPGGYNYSGIYAGWNLNLDGIAGGDSPWYFRGDNQYPILAYGTMGDFPLWDYDTDNDRLLEVNNLAQLNAIRWDLNTDGVVTAADQANYTAAFPGGVAGLGCAQGATAAACNGYELLADLDFDTDGDGDVDAADSGGLYWNGGWGWAGIGHLHDGYPVYFTGTFQGNGKIIANLYIHQPPSDVVTLPFGLFRYVSSTGVIDDVKLREVNIRVRFGDPMGALVGDNRGSIRGSSATGSINSSDYGVVGGLVGDNFGSIADSYAKVEIMGSPEVVGGLVGINTGSIVSSYASGAIVTNYNRLDNPVVGGLAGISRGTITDSYSSGPVKATGNWASVGGLVGSGGGITASYATGPVSATGNNAYVGGLVGASGGITASYATGAVSAAGDNSYVGGLAGLSGTITASYATGPVSAAGANSYIGGLAGNNSGSITAAYSRSPVKATGNRAAVGGLVGTNRYYRDSVSNTTYPAIITASYAMGPVVATGSSPSVGGLVGKNSGGTAVDSYWDIPVSGQSSSALGTGVQGMRAYGTGSYAGLFANWNLNLDGVAGNDDPWAFPDGQYPALKYGGLAVADQVQFYLWAAPAVGRTARTNWHVASWLTRARGHGGFIWERSADGITWTTVFNRKLGIGSVRNNNHFQLFIEPFEANQRFRVRRMSVERGWVYGYISPPVPAWSGPTAALTFASGHSAPRVGQAIAISGSNAVKWIRCDDAAGNGCAVLVSAATGYTPVAADQGKYLYAYRYYDNSQSVKTMGKTGYIGPIAAAATTP